MKRYTTAIILILFSVLALQAGGRRDSVVVSLITCWPGPEVYELCGHEAIRVRGVGENNAHLDTVWNYGVFDFAQPNFLYRFVRGETDYMLWGYPTALFMYEYVAQGRRVVEQDLNLSYEEGRRLLGMLREESKPEHRVYRYNYVKDNCATRIVNRIDQAADGWVVYPDTIVYGTFRNEMRAFHKDYPWYQFGIDIALGTGIDYPLRGKEEMFVPLDMMRRVDGAHFSDGRRMVTATRVLNAGVDDATLGPSAWYTGPLFWSWVVFAAAVVICLIQWRRNTVLRWVYCVWFTLLGVAGCVIAFLVFISTHEATSPNLMLFWLNPLQLLVPVFIWFRRPWRMVAEGVAWLNVTVLTIVLVLWPFQTQSANPAFFPLAGATLLLSASYAIISQKKSYNISRNNHNNEEVRNLGAGGSGHARRGRTDRRRTSASGSRNRG